MIDESDLAARCVELEQLLQRVTMPHWWHISWRVHPEDQDEECAYTRWPKFTIRATVRVPSKDDGLLELGITHRVSFKLPPRGEGFIDRFHESVEHVLVAIATHEIQEHTYMDGQLIWNPHPEELR